MCEGGVIYIYIRGCDIYFEYTLGGVIYTWYTLGDVIYIYIRVCDIYIH